MKIKDVNDVCIIDIGKESISSSDVDKLKNIINKKAHHKRIGLNFANTFFVDYAFWDFLEKEFFTQKISVFNLNTELFLSLFISGYDKVTNIYMNEEDFKFNKRIIVNRRFKLLKSA